MNAGSGKRHEAGGGPGWWWPPFAVLFGVFKAGDGVADLQHANGATSSVAWGIAQVLFGGLLLVAGGLDLVARFRKR